MAQLNWQKQLYLAIALFTLGTGAYWFEYSHRPKTEEKAEESKKIFTLKDLQLQAIRIEGGLQTFELKCVNFEKQQCKPGDNSKWEVILPSKMQADDSNANALVSSLNNLNSNETISLADETPEKRTTLLKEYGLDTLSRQAKTVRRVTITLASGQSHLILGNAHPISEDIFALREDAGKVDETKVYLVPSFFKTTFDHDFTYWRNKKLFDFAATDVEKFKLDGSKEKISGTKKDTQWSLSGSQGGADVLGDIESVEALLSAAAYLTAREFESNPKAALSGAKQVLKLVVDTKAASKDQPGKSISLTLFEKNGARKQLLATGSTFEGVVYIEAGAQGRLDKGLKDLRQTKLLTSLERYSIKRIEVSGPAVGKPPLVLVTGKDAKWEIEPVAGAVKPEINSDKVQALLERLSGNRVKEFISNKPADESQALHVILGDDKDAKKRHFIFWKKGADVFAKDLNSKRNEILSVDPAIATDLPAQRDHFNKKAAAAPAVPALPEKKSQ